MAREPDHLKATKDAGAGRDATVPGATRGAAEAGVPLAPGTKLLARYRIEHEIGRGGMGIVYAARDEKLERTVAIKVLPVRAIDAETRERFLREARAAAALNHPAIVAVYDAGEADGRPFLVMEHVDGTSLDDRPPASIEEALAISRTVCDALEHAHRRGVVHRDLKPGNIIALRERGESGCKLTDMGIALTRGSARLSASGAIVGTPHYMAPEQALGEEVDGRADLYALGVMLYAWSAGRLPFDGDDALAVVSQHIHAPVVPPRTFRPDLPSGLEPLILALLAKSPAERPPSAAQVREALAAVGVAGSEAERPGVTIEGLMRGRLVGRRDELERLSRMWRAVLEGRASSALGGGRLALISGEPGVGKTRLAWEVTATARLDGAPVVSGGCYENEATTPYLPFVEAFRRLTGERDDAALGKLLGDTASEIARLAPEIEARLGPFPDRPRLGPPEERLRLFDHVARFLRRVAAPRGLLVFLDDLQWADHGSLALLHWLLRQLADDRVLFLGTYREVELDRAHPLSKALVSWERERLATRIRLDRLDRAATARMLRTLLGETDLSEEFVGALYAETEGNPFFVEEVVKTLVAEGNIVHEGSSWRRRQSSGEFALPQSVKAAIGSRLDRVSEACSDLLRTAAVLGKEFGFDELASVAGGSEDELLDALDEATAAQLVAPVRGETFRFTHDKIREVLYEELNPVRRRRVHARIASGLAELERGGRRVAVEDLAHHFVESGDEENGLVWAGRAAEAAITVFAYDEAQAMLARARECAEALGRESEVARIDERMGEASLARGDVNGAIERFERALAAAGDDAAWNRLRTKLGEAYVVSGDGRGLEHVCAALAELDPVRQAKETAHALTIEARYSHLRGELQRAAATYRRAIEMAEREGDGPLLVRAYSMYAGTLQHLAEYDESDAMARRAIEVGRRERLPEGEMLGFEFLSENELNRGRWRESIGYGEREEALAAECHARERYGWAQMRAFALVWLGRLAEAAVIVRRGLEASEWTGDLRLALFMRMAEALHERELGRLDAARDGARAVMEEADAKGLLSHRIFSRSYLVGTLMRIQDAAQADAAREAAEQALRHARVAVELLDRGESAGVALMETPVIAEALLRGGDLAEVRRLLARHEPLARRPGSEQRLAQNRRIAGLVALLEGRAAEACALLDEAIAAFEARGSVIDLAQALGDRAEALRREGQAAAAAAEESRAAGIRARLRNPR